MRVGRLTFERVKRKEFLEKLRTYKFDTLEQKKLVLHGWLKICLTGDMKNYIFISLDDEFHMNPSLERSVARGRDDNWLTGEFVQTDKGLSVQWFLDNKSGCS